MGSPSGLEPGAPFGSRYRILRELGAGGMGVVYQAWDDSLGVAVALKIVRPLADDNWALAREVEKRFKRELLLARQVTHKHVVRIHDLGEIDGTNYITMPYIQGEDLATVLNREGRLPVDRALRIARQTAEGLHAAHEAGVVHRDLKPANIMIDRDGNALIMDFGIAFSPVPSADNATPVGQATPVWLAPAPASGATTTAALPADWTDATTRAADTREAETRSLSTLETTGGTVLSTGAGGIVGTLEYMAPEQARGRAVDQRADIYAFGLILSDMLTGLRRARPGATPIDELTARITTEPERLRARNDAIPQPLDDLVNRCLQLDPAARFETTADLLAALGRLDAEGQRLPEPARGLTRQAKIASVLMVAILMIGTWWISRTPPEVAHAPVSLIIADFENRTGEPSFEGTVEQALASAVEGASFISAFPRKDAQELSQQLASTRRITDRTAQLIAVREGLNFIVGGSIERRGGGYRLAARELDPQGKTIAEFNATASGKEDVLKAVSTLASQLRDALGDTSPETSRQADIETFTSSSLEAVREYALAQDLASAYRDEEAIAHYQAALKLDKNFGRAYSGWAVSASKLRRTEEMQNAYKEALARLDRMSEREQLRTQGAYFLQVAGSYDKAREVYDQLVQKYPGDRAGHSNLAVSYFFLRDFEKAREHGRKAIDLYPRTISFRNNYALFAMYAGDYANAASEARKTLELPGSNYLAWIPIAAAAIVDPKGGDAARDAYLAMAKTGPAGASLSALGLADLAMYQGRFADAARIARAGIADDLKAKNTGGAVTKRIVLAEALLAQHKMPEARQEALALKATADLRAQVSAAPVLLRAGEVAEARAIADGLVGQISKDSRAYGKIIEAELALARNQPAVAIDAVTESRERKFSDVWLARLVMGIAYLGGGAPTEANTELEAATKRRGEASDLFLDDLPTFRYLAELPYWRGRAEEALNRTPAAKQDYEAFIALRPAGDPLGDDARKRLAALK